MRLLTRLYGITGKLLLYGYTLSGQLLSGRGECRGTHFLASKAGRKECRSTLLSRERRVQEPCDTLNGGPPGQNFVWWLTILEFLKKRYTAILGSAPIEGLSWTTAKSVGSSCWSSKVNAEILTLFISGNGRRSFTFPTKPHWNILYMNCVHAQSFVNCASNTIP